MGHKNQYGKKQFISVTFVHYWEKEFTITMLAKTPKTPVVTRKTPDMVKMRGSMEGLTWNISDAEEVFCDAVNMPM